MSRQSTVELPFVLRSSAGDPIYGEIRFRKAVRHVLPTVIICHSFMSFKNWGFFPYVAERIASEGFAALTFNFSLNGVEAHNNRITNFLKFEQNTISQELNDLASVTLAVSENPWRLEGIDCKRIVYLGHSRGGGLAIIAAALDARVKALVTWSSISTFDRWSEHQKEKWKSMGYLSLSRDSEVSLLRLGLPLLNDVEQNRDRLSITSAAARVRVPWLIVHGTTDVIVPPHEAETLYRSAVGGASTELAMLEHVGHLYNAGSERDDHYRTLNQILDTTIHWLHRHLKQETS